MCRLVTMLERQSSPQRTTAVYGSADLAALRADIAKGISDVQAAGVRTVAIALIKAAGRAKLKTQRANRLTRSLMFVAEDSQSNADRVLDNVEREANIFTAQPLMGRTRPELADCCFAELVAHRTPPTLEVTCIPRSVPSSFRHLLWSRKRKWSGTSLAGAALAKNGNDAIETVIFKKAYRSAS